MNRMGGNFDLRCKYKEWIDWDKNPETKRKIQKYYEDKDYDSLKKRLLCRLAWGTTGLRGVMDAGYYGMNDLVIIQTSQGLASYCLKAIQDMPRKGAVIGYDGRHHSQRFSQLTALAFVSRGVHVHLFSRVAPTPFVAYGVLQLGCGCGVMITASHNPKEENGYKVFWENGAQINAPHDRGIQDAILANLKPWATAWDLEALHSHPLVRDTLDEVRKRYFATMANNVIDREVNASTALRFTYSAMHGVGHDYLTEAFEVCGFKHFFPVKAQMSPDPTFPTVKLPNPAEGRSALELSFKTAEETGSAVVLATDPDADRLAVAERQDNDDWKIFTGNEMGALLGCWMWSCYKTENPDCNPSNVYMISSAVSSKILKAVARAEGFNFVETLTGFKWMANKADELILRGKIVLFVFEESIGFMCGTSVLDKDGISAGMQVAQLAAHLRNQGLTLAQELRNIFSRHGLHLTRTSYFICHHHATIVSLFERIREYGGYDTYPTRLGHYSIVGVRDLTSAIDTTQAERKPVLPVTAADQMITFYFRNNFSVTLRTSGLEPKVTYYVELCALPEQGDWPFLEKELNSLEKLVVREWLRPDSNRLITRPV